MLSLVREGGFPMIFVLLFGAATLIAAVAHAWRPAARRLSFIHWMMAATAFSVLSGVAACLGATFHHVPDRFGAQRDWPLVLLTGLGESMAPAIVGFTLLSLAALVAAVGSRRLE